MDFSLVSARSIKCTQNSQLKGFPGPTRLPDLHLLIASLSSRLRTSRFVSLASIIRLSETEIMSSENYESFPTAIDFVTQIIGLL
jgi:hypothetical protein